MQTPINLHNEPSKQKVTFGSEQIKKSMTNKKEGLSSEEIYF